MEGDSDQPSCLARTFLVLKRKVPHRGKHLILDYEDYEDYEERKVKGSTGICKGAIKITFPGRRCMEGLMECRKLGSVDRGLC